MKKFSIVLILLSLNSLGVLLAQDNLRPAKLFLNAFSSQCPQVVTRNVSATLVSLQSLYNSIEELKKDSNCGGANAFSAAISRYTSLYENFESRGTSELDKIVLEKRIALYSTLINDPTLDSTQLTFLRSEIVQSQATLVNISSSIARFDNLSGKQARVANQLVKGAEDFLTELQTENGNACYQKNTAKITSMMSNALMVTAAFSSGGTSLALAGGSVITKSVGKYVADLKYNKTLGNLHDIEMTTALRCVSQALTDQFCSANEVQRLIEERVDAQNSNSTHYDGIDLLSYQLAPLNSWLNEVYSGSSIASEGDLINREKSEIQAEFLRKTSTYLDTYATVKRKFFLTLDSNAKITSAIAQNVDCLALLLAAPSLTPCLTSYMPDTSTMENPIYNTYNKSLMPYILAEPDVHNSVPLCGETVCTTFSQYIGMNGKSLSVADWDRIIIEAKSIIQSSQTLVNLERSRMISVDAYSIIVNAKRELKGETTPINGLKKIISNADRITKYLYELGCKLDSDCEGTNNKYAPEINNIKITKDLTKVILNLVNEGMIPRSLPLEILPKECTVNKSVNSFNEVDSEDVLELKSFQITLCISKILKLRERGTDVYFSKVRNMVSYEMEARLANKDLGEGVLNIINATKTDLVQSILNSYSTRDNTISLGELEISLESAQNNSKETLITFFDFFKKSLLESLNSTKLTKTEKNDLCFRILPYLYSSKENLLKSVFPTCKDAQFNSYKKGPTIRFTDYVNVTPKSGFKSASYDLVKPRDIKKYFCGYRQYNRANLLIDEQNNQLRRDQRIK